MTDSLICAPTKDPRQVRAPDGRVLTIPPERAQHESVLIATGDLYKAKPLNAPNDQSVVKALDYLIASNRVGLGDEVAEFTSGALNAAGKRVIVIGRGDTAMDCVPTAVRQGAKSAPCLYRRDRANMPGSQREVANAEEEGVEFVWLSAPKGFTGGVEVEGVMVQKMRLGAPDASGRQSPEVIEGADYVEPADLVVQALGFEPEELPTLWGVQELKVTRWGTIKADFRTRMSDIGVSSAFAGIGERLATSRFQRLRRELARSGHKPCQELGILPCFR